MIEILITNESEAGGIETLADARMDDAGNLLVSFGALHCALRSPMVQPLQDGENVWRFVERCAAAMAETAEGFDRMGVK